MSSQLELLAIPQPKAKLNIESSDLKEYLADSNVSQAKYWESGEDFIQQHIQEFLKAKGSYTKKSEIFRASKSNISCHI